MEVGNYSVKIPVQDMNKKIWVTQTAPNREESDRQEKVVKGVPAPKPSINEMDTDDTRVTGKGVANSKVYVRIPGRVERHVDVNSNGDWYLDTGLLNGGQEIIVHQELPRKLNSEEAKINVQQLPQMPPPSINYIDTTHDWVSGRGEPGATVKVHVHGVVIRDVGVDGARKLGYTYRKTIRWKKNRSATIQSRKTMVRLGRNKCGISSIRITINKYSRI